MIHDFLTMLPHNINRVFPAVYSIPTPFLVDGFRGEWTGFFRHLRLGFGFQLKMAGQTPTCDNIANYCMNVSRMATF